MTSCLRSATPAPVSPEVLQRQLAGQIWAWRMYILALTAVSVLVVSAWIGYLTAALRPPPSEDAWRTMWIGFDLMELAAYVVAGWAAWRRRYLVVPALYSAAVLLVCDAWFDTTLAWHTNAWWGSILLAGLLELPIALIFTVLAHSIATAARISLYASVGLPVSRARRPGLLPPLMPGRG